MEVKIKRALGYPKEWPLPTYAHEGDACFDLIACIPNRPEAYVNLKAGTAYSFKTGLCFEIPNGFTMLVFSRSGMGKKGVRLSNSVGIIDSGYRNEVEVPLHNDSNSDYLVHDGDRIAQAMIIPVPIIKWEEVDELSETVRGLNGFGSTGR